MNERATYMVHTRTYNVQTCTFAVHRFYIWYAYTTMVCSVVLWHEQLMKYVCTTHNQCYGTGFPNPVQAVFMQGYTCLEWLRQVGSFPVAFLQNSV